MTAGRAGGKKRRGRGVKRPADVIVPPEALKPEYRGHCWYFVDHLKSGGELPILTIEEAVFDTPTLSAEAAKLFGDIYGDASVTHTLVYGHHDNSQCERKTVLSCNHKGSLRFWQEVKPHLGPRGELTFRGRRGGAREQRVSGDPFR